ncbi:MAG: hypothetical protein RL160_1187 [Bacteroidota bacterium]|jgi:type II secretory pathway pseudopilin PulG
MRYYIHDGKQQKGPFEANQLLAAGLNAETFVWREGLDQWVKAGLLTELESMLTPLPPPFTGEAPESTEIAQTTEEVSASEPPVEIAENIQETKPQPAEKSGSNTPRRMILVVAILFLFMLGALAIVYFQKRETSTALEQSQTVVQQQKETIDEAQQELDAKQAIQDAIVKEQAEAKAAEEKKQKEARKNWTSFLTAAVDSYTPVSLGGFTNIRVAVHNNGAYPVDLVEVQVSYWTANNYLFKSETVQVSNVDSGNTGYAYSPDSQRGSRLTAEIVRVKAHAFQFCYDGFNTSGQADDPYRCAE